METSSCTDFTNIRLGSVIDEFHKVARDVILRKLLEQQGCSLTAALKMTG